MVYKIHRQKEVDRGVEDRVVKRICPCVACEVGSEKKIGKLRQENLYYVEVTQRLQKGCNAFEGENQFGTTLMV